MNHETKVKLAMSQMVLKAPFFAYLTLQRPVTFTETMTKTAGADARGRIYINPTFIKDRSVDEVVFLLAHEAMHVAFLHCHPSTAQGRDQRACNIAMDKVINETLIAERLGEFIEGGQRHAGAEKMTWEQLYVDPPEDDGGGGGGSGGDSGSSEMIGRSGDVGGIGDDLLPCPDGEPIGVEAETLRDQMRGELVSAANAAKMVGALSANMQRVLKDIIFPPTPWHAILERFMQSFVSSDYSWKRPNRRFVGQGIYLPSLDKQPRMGKIGLIADTSGSIGQREADAFNGHFNRIIETCMPEEVIVLSVDSEVCGVQRFEPDDFPVKWDPKGGGGTDMREGWAWFDKNETDLDCIVCLTDGLTPWPDSVNTPSIVLSTTDKVAPAAVGETVHFKV
jgi:predicted metal-dependent peptidase